VGHPKLDRLHQLSRTDDVRGMVAANWRELL